MVTVYFFTNVAPHYRAPLWDVLLNDSNWNTHFFYCDDHKSGVKMIDLNKAGFVTKQEHFHKLKCYRWKDRKQVWQKGVVSQCIKGGFDYAIFLGEISRLSTWIAAIVCRLRGVHVTFWGHGLYGNESRLRLILKKTLFRLAHAHLLYERRAKELLIKQGFNPSKLYVIFNSLDYDTHKSLCHKLELLDKKEVFYFFKNPAMPVIIFIGRLTPVKKLELLLEAVNRINQDSPKLNLVIIGDGPERKKLEKMGTSGLENKWLYFTGACYDENEIGKYLLKSDLCVSPGNVGLTAVHSLSFGTPVCTHDNMSNQMPEAEIIKDGYNGFLFKENNIDDLKNKLEHWFTGERDESVVRKRAYEMIDRYYNPNYQLTVINRLVNGQKPEL